LTVRTTIFLTVHFYKYYSIFFRQSPKKEYDLLGEGSAGVLNNAGDFEVEVFEE